MTPPTAKHTALLSDIQQLRTGAATLLKYHIITERQHLAAYVKANELVDALPNNMPKKKAR
jgi:hypothetical protein